MATTPTVRKNAESARKGKTRRWLTFGAAGAILFVALDCLGVWVLVKLERRYYSMDDIDARLEVIRQQGLPTNEEELQSWYPDAPDEENAALVFQKAFDAYLEIAGLAEAVDEPAAISSPSPTTESPAQAQQDLSNYVAKNSECLELVLVALQKPRCHFSLDFHTGWICEVGNHILGFEQIGRLLFFKAMLEGAESPAAAWDSIITEARLSQVLVNEPFGEAPRVRAELESDVAELLESMLAGAKCKESDLAELGQILSRDDLQAAEFRIMATERCLGIINMHDFLYHPLSIHELIQRGRDIYPSNIPVLSRLEQKQTLKVYLDLMNPLVELSKRPRYLRKEKLDALSARIEHPMRTILSHPFVAPRALMRVESSIEVLGALDRACARRSVITTGIAVERYRIANGRLPDSLDALVPQFLNAVPLDIYDGQPLRYLKRDKGYVVYSIYENERDDGGAEIHNFKESKEKGDLTFIVER